MRWILAAALLVPTHAHADDVAIGAAVGAGGQGDSGYGALELRLDGEWRGVRLGLGGRAVWEGGAFRTREWARIADAASLIRQLEAHAGPVALAAGALAPSTIGHVADGYRTALDDRARTGARVAVVTRDAATDSIDVDASAEIDDVLDPALVGGALAWQIVPAWGMRAATAVDPSTSRMAIEVGGARRWERENARIELGASIVGERWLTSDSPVGGQPVPDEHIGLGAVGFASAAFDRVNARWTIGADVRAGNGTNGAAFGPLYRAERAAIIDDRSSAASPDTMMSTILDDVRAGIGAGMHAGVASDAGWVALAARYRSGLGPLGTISAGAPMGRRLQAGAWLAASPRATAGAAEVRLAWATHFYTSLQMARMYTPRAASSDLVQPDALAPAWSATVWFGASTR